MVVGSGLKFGESASRLLTSTYYHCHPPPPRKTENPSTLVKAFDKLQPPYWKLVVTYNEVIYSFLRRRSGVGGQKCYHSDTELERGIGDVLSNLEILPMQDNYWLLRFYFVIISLGIYLMEIIQKKKKAMWLKIFIIVILILEKNRNNLSIPK